MISDRLNVTSAAIILFFFFTVTPSSAETVKYTYDDNYRLTRVEHVNWAQVEYQYDEVGNRTFKNLLYSKASINAISTNPNSAAGYTNGVNVIISNTCDAQNGTTCNQMKFSNDNLSWTTAEGHVSTRAWTLPSGDGTKTVYARFKDNLETWSDVYADTIILDTVRPTTTASPAGGTFSTAQTVTLLSNETTTIHYTVDGSTPTTSSPVYSGQLTISGTTTLKYLSIDLAGNEEAVKTETYIIPDRIGVFVIGTWYIDTTGSGTWNEGADRICMFGVGVTGAIPVAGDWNGTGYTKIGIYEDGTWYLDLNGSGAWEGEPIDKICYLGGGLTNAVPVTGDWDGLGITKIGVYDEGTWYMDTNGNGVWDGTPIDSMLSFDAGQIGATPVTGDWTGNGLTKIGVYKDGIWFLDTNGNGTWDGTPTDETYTFGIGLTGAIPVTGDWTGDGITKLGVYLDGTWYVDANGNGIWDGTPAGDGEYSFGGGLTGAIPVSGHW